MNKNNIIKLLGATLIAVGSLQLMLRVKDIWWSLAMLFRPGSFVTIQEYLVYSAASLFFFIILPLADVPLPVRPCVSALPMLAVHVVFTFVAPPIRPSVNSLAVALILMPTAGVNPTVRPREGPTTHKVV